MSGEEPLASESTETQQRLRPGVLQTAILDEIAERLLEIKETLDKEHPEGIVEPIEPITVTGQRRQVEAHFTPWHSVSIVNSIGPDSVWAIVNTEKSFEPHQVDVGEVYTVNMVVARIKDVLLWCNQGETATVKVVGVR